MGPALWVLVLLPVLPGLAQLFLRLLPLGLLSPQPELGSEMLIYQELFQGQDRREPNTCEQLFNRLWNFDGLCDLTFLRIC